MMKIPKKIIRRNPLIQRTQMKRHVRQGMGKGVYGSYDGLILHPPDKSTWKKYPSSNPLLKNPIFVPQHSGGPLRNEVVPVNIPDNSMFLFAKNIDSPFCSSSFSTSTGQVCTTKDQRNFINTRGHQKSVGGNPDF